MAKVRRRGKRFFVDYTYRGRRVRKSAGSSRRIAEIIAKDIEVKMAKEDAGFFLSDISSENFKNKILEYFKNHLRDRAYARYKLAVEKFFAMRSLDKISKITTAHIEAFKIARLCNGKITKQTVNTDLKILSTAFNLALKWGHIRQNPVKGIEYFKQAQGKVIRFFSQEEATAIIRNAPEPFNDIFLVLLNTGLRRDELRMLEIKDVDFKNKRIWIRAPKSGDDSESVPINSAIESVLKKCCSKRQGLVFPDENGRPHYAQRFWRVMKQMISILEIPDANVHTWRHTYASWLVMAGVDLTTVKELMRHKNIETTMVYAHLSKPHLHQAANIIGTIWAQSLDKKNNHLQVIE